MLRGKQSPNISHQPSLVKELLILSPPFQPSIVSQQSEQPSPSHVSDCLASIPQEEDERTHMLDEYTVLGPQNRPAATPLIWQKISREPNIT